MPPARPSAPNILTLRSHLLLIAISGAWIALVVAGVIMMSRAGTTQQARSVREALPVAQSVPRQPRLRVIAPPPPRRQHHPQWRTGAAHTTMPIPGARDSVVRPPRAWRVLRHLLPAGEPLPPILPAVLKAATAGGPSRAGHANLPAVPGLTQARSLSPSQAGVPAAIGQRTAQVWVTGYSLQGITATGIPSGPGICAVDPAFIPLGSRIVIERFGACVAADTGPAVVGAHIDVWVPSEDQAYGITGWYTIRW